MTIIFKRNRPKVDVEQCNLSKPYMHCSTAGFHSQIVGGHQTPTTYAHKINLQNNMITSVRIVPDCKRINNLNSTIATTVRCTFNCLCQFGVLLLYERPSDVLTPSRSRTCVKTIGGAQRKQCPLCAHHTTSSRAQTPPSMTSNSSLYQQQQKCNSELHHMEFVYNIMHNALCLWLAFRHVGVGMQPVKFTRLDCIVCWIEGGVCAQSDED